MRKLKCTSCGGRLSLQTNADGHVIGQCSHCGGEYVVDAKSKQHVILEHRFPDGQPARATRPTRRAVVGLGLAAGGIIGFGAALQFLMGASRPAADDHLRGTAVFNVGGEGAAPGQFRSDAQSVMVDSQDRAVVMDSEERFYIFAPDGAFLTHFPMPVQGRLMAVLAAGDIIVNAQNRFHRLDLMNGQILETVDEPKRDFWVASSGSCPTPDGGFATYTMEDAARDSATSSLPGPDELLIFGRDMKLRRRLTGLMAQALAADPMIADAPRASSIVIDAAGSIFIDITAAGDLDPRCGIFEFNANGVFQRRIAIEQAYWGQIAGAPDGSLWYADPWMSALQQVHAGGVRKIYAPTAAGREMQLGQPNAIAFYNNGDLAVLGMYNRLIRMVPPPL
ncbi:hypothetical protein [Ketogulonicigenium vulgare]|uniref:Uncharacterized protein n=1 Tax=Ketogulonicigenium vulgare (strain WSH-001) TaxID=759362 RepID=F9Y6G5_KETVW|nr:hypothetical protein [Ketogulonicigenium vulgare]ADO42718.1 conserved hypothetical protein [Ketogulonicigenium vulgare Y25]AEM40911.1 hypothetical protein KVU_1072 [Ketogulonicigenium vulgare WSH-001]ALJ81063.1 hypothetical protein KVH_07665 [Ketogulonicigenium vulgare]ANW33818.1 hypothetical protein KvSKV_07630 [Ketogulonicigenium vulgare]AOZ54630.1 hypothetical protein KVC_1616 [Ketogulonicigenium vulgare]